MKIATAGKGGAGKTTVAGTVARILAENGRKVLAIDGDPNPNLGFMLGMPPQEAAAVESIPPSIIASEVQPDGTSRLRMTIPESELLARYARKAPSNIELIVMGKPADGSAGSGWMCASHRAVRGLISTMSGHCEHTVTDLAAGLEHLKRGTASKVDTMLIIAEPYYRSLEAAARTHSLARELALPHVLVVANKVKSESDAAAINAFCQQKGMPLIELIPNEEAFIEAERRAIAPIDFAPDAKGLLAMRRLVGKLDALS